jgi:hypothetical protein
MTEQEKNQLLEEAKNRFPINSVINSTHGSKDTIKNHNFRFGINDSAKNNIYYDNGNIELYNHKSLKWAEIISKPESNLKVEDLVEGEVYYITYNSGREFINLSKGKHEVGYYISIDDKTLEKSGFCSGAKTYKPASPEDKLWLEACIKADKFIPKEEALKSIETKYEYEVVHCETQEQWDFVIEKLGYKSLDYWDKYKQDSCIELPVQCYCDIDFYREKNSKIYSFQEWCDKFGHKPDFKQEVMKEESLVGRYLKALVDNAQYTGTIKGNYYEIVEETESSIIIYVNSIKMGLTKKLTQNYELMPKGFTPETYGYSSAEYSISIDPITPKQAIKSIFDKDFNNPLNEVLELPKSSKKKTKQLIY